MNKLRLTNFHQLYDGAATFLVALSAAVSLSFVGLIFVSDHGLPFPAERNVLTAQVSLVTQGRFDRDNFNERYPSLTRRQNQYSTDSFKERAEFFIEKLKSLAD